MSKPVPATPEEAKPVWIACRAPGGSCDGTYATLVFKQRLQDGMVNRGMTYRYRCLTCKKVFYITH